MMSYIIPLKTFTLAIEVKHKGWKVKTIGKPRRVNPDKDPLIPTMSPCAFSPAKEH